MDNNQTYVFIIIITICLKFIISWLMYNYQFIQFIINA